VRGGGGIQTDRISHADTCPYTYVQYACYGNISHLEKLS
jgi:hypothetical protein